MMMLLSLLACKKDGKENNAAVDVYVKSILVDGEPVFGLVHYVVGYNVMNSVVVNGPGGLTEPLNAFDNSKMTYYTEPSIMLGTYSATPPAAGIYNFGVTFEDGEQKVFTNTLATSVLYPPNISSLTKTTDGSKVKIAWDPMTNVDYYQVSISKAGTTVFLSPPFTLATAESAVEIPIAYITSYSQGTYTYTLEAVDYENVETGTIQSLSSASADIDL